MGRALRNERVRQGLSHRDVSRRLGIAEDQLRAAESGSLRRTDQLSTLKTVRRYADLLGLPGDRYALAILEQWPSSAPGTPPGLGRLDPGGFRDDPTAATPSVHGARTATSTWTHTPVGTALTPFEAELVAYGGPLADGPQDAGAVAGWEDAGDATGIVPAVPIATSADVVRRNPMPWPFRAAAVVLAIAVAAGGALLAVDKLHPSWLRGIGLVKSSVPPAPANGTAAVGSHRTGAGHASSGSGAGGSSGSSGAVVADAALHPQSTSGRSATLAAGVAPVRVTVSATGAPCWIDVTSSTSATPLFSGVLAAGARRTFTVAHGASVELGSSSGRVSAVSRSGHLSTYRPPVAPFTLTVRSSS